MSRAALTRSAAVLTSAAFLIFCWQAARVRPSELLSRDAAAGVGSFVAGLFPPDLSPDFLRVVAIAMARTLGIAITGTALSVVLALPLGVMATPALWHRGVLAAGQKPGLASIARRVMASSARVV